jgi:hypothetical protein
MFPFWIELTLVDLEQCLGVLAAVGACGVNLFGWIR